MPVIKVETIAYSKFALAQSSIKPNPQKQKLMFKIPEIWRANMTQEMTAVTVAPIIEERDTNLDFLRVIPKAKKPIIMEAQEVKSANPA